MVLALRITCNYGSELKLPDPIHRAERCILDCPIVFGAVVALMGNPFGMASVIRAGSFSFARGIGIIVESVPSSEIGD